jgi:hypothetical protein
MLNTHSALLQWERQNEEDSVVVLSDVWLDRPETLDRLRTLFAGDDQCDTEMMQHADCVQTAGCTVALPLRLLCVPAAAVHAPGRSQPC